MNQWLTLAISSLLALLQRELYTLLPRLSYWLIRHAAKRSPNEIRLRYEEEWLAESEQYVGSVAQITHAASLILCGTPWRLTRDHYEWRLLELEDRLNTALLTWNDLEMQLIAAQEQLRAQRPILWAAFKQSANGHVESCQAAANNARNTGNHLLADKLQELTKSLSAWAMTFEQAVSILSRNMDLEIEFLMGVVLQSRQLVMDATLRVSGTLRLVRRRRSDWEVIEDVVSDIASRVHTLKHVNSIPINSEREARKAHSARISAVILELARPESSRRALTQQPQA